MSFIRGSVQLLPLFVREANAQHVVARPAFWFWRPASGFHEHTVATNNFQVKLSHSHLNLPNRKVLFSRPISLKHQVSGAEAAPNEVKTWPNDPKRGPNRASFFAISGPIST